MNTFQSILLIIAILLLIEIVLRTVGTTLTVIFKLFYKAYLYYLNNRVDFLIRTSITIISLILIIFVDGQWNCKTCIYYSISEIGTIN